MQISRYEYEFFLKILHSIGNVFQIEYRSKRMTATRLGLCSNYLSRLQEGDVVLVKTRPGTFRYCYFVTK